MSLDDTTEHGKGEAADTEAERPLNRAEKRALEHNKKSAPANGAMPRGGSGGAGMGKGVARAGNVRLPRTGHK